MSYILDSCTIRTLQNYYPDSFPSIWSNINGLIEHGDLFSVREVLNEIVRQGSIKPFVLQWAEENRAIFKIPSPEETLFLRDNFFENPHYQQIVRRKNILKGYPVADPFIISSAFINKGTVITEESYKNNSNSIPNICENYGIPCLNLEEFIQMQSWTF